MLLVADIGNTQTHLGVYDGKDLVLSWRLSTRATDTADELLISLRTLLANDLEPLLIHAVAVASVVPALSGEWRVAAQKLSGSEPLLLTHETAVGFSCSYATPEEIGADRIADALAAVEFYGAPVIVVDFGTATNMEVINKEGAFVGGIIAPGLVTSTNALFDAAARLPRIDIETPPQVIGISTKTAVQSGLTYGEIDRIDGLVRRVFDELGYEAPVIATGGLSRRVLKLSQTITDVNDNLTLEGLRLAYERALL
ncbi:MAG: type III pantothenate kinase [Coriobacteriia bacterium]|nr:type III pantothenate kinase [Coriobacteriia bacterium]MCL2749484.1 type III pantothenate kinase [Coriobacteriia bacterium]